MTVDESRAETGAERAARRYLAAVNEADFVGLEALLAPDAVLEHPAGVFTGAASITTFYRESVLGLGTTLLALSTTCEENRCVVEVEGRSPSGDDVVHACDVFDVDGQGRIVSMRVYIR